MDKYKIKRVKGINTIVYKSKNVIKLDQDAVGKIRANLFPSLLQIYDANYNEVSYLINDYITLKDYLKNNVSIDVMYSIISQTIDIINDLSAEGMSAIRLVLDSEYVFVDASQSKLFFIYEPYISSREMTIYINFWIDIIDTTKYKDVDIREQCQQLKHYLEESKNRSLNDIYAYVNKTNNNNISQNTTSDLYVKATNLSNEGGSVEEDFEPETTLLVQDGFKSDRLVHDSKAFIIRKKNMEKVEVTKDIFVVGKSANCDYTIIGNPTISRQHIVIYNNRSHYSFVDKGSTNRTYLNGIVSEYNREYKIKDGDVLRLSNELFEFKVNG